ncbi:MAG: ABC transporter ATP-binding protein/permease [Chloroflexi bacterium]|nr:ABC transporter ATP-binding protein/permease [Chloroflexota bacterium]
MAVASVAQLFWSAISLSLPLAVRYLVDSIFVSRDQSQLNMVSLALVALFIFQGVIAYGQTYLLAFVAQRVVADLRLNIHGHMLGLPLRFFNERRTGEMVSRVTNDVTVIQGVLTEAPLNLLRQVITIIGGLALMLSMNWRLTLLVIGLIPSLILIAVFFGRRLERLSTIVQDRLADATAALEEALSGIRVVKSFTQEKFERQRFGQQIEATFSTAMRRARLRSAFVPLISLLAFCALVVILWFGGQQVISGGLTPGELIAFLFYMVLVGGPMGEFASLYSQIREASGAAQRIFEIMQVLPEPQESQPTQPLPPVRGQVRFAGVSFRYEDGDPKAVLEDIDLLVPPDQVVALVGPSGVGKTTLVNLIPRFFDPTRGVVEIDGRDIRKVTLPSLRSQIGLVPQETFLFAGTVRENIAYGRPGVSQVEIETAAKAAYAHDFIQQAPGGYEAVIGERGVRLSAGQRQRLAIARALLKDPRILILDEATSALDTESERWVQAALERLMQGRTTFVIAHRLSTIQHADRILVLQEGRIVEDGAHAELLEHAGLYRHLWRLQFASTELPEIDRQLGVEAETYE